MSRWSRRHSTFCVGLVLVLAVLANLGLQIHAHHGLGGSYRGTAMLSIASHGEPDPSLHLERLAETRYLTCPGCLAQQQVRGAHLLESGWLQGPTTTSLQVGFEVDAPVARVTSGVATRAPPSC